MEKKKMQKLGGLINLEESIVTVIGATKHVTTLSSSKILGWKKKKEDNISGTKEMYYGLNPKNTT